MILFDVHNLYHPDASMANIYVYPSGEKYTSEKVTYNGTECTFYTTSGTVISVSHNTKQWISARINLELLILTK